MVNVTAPTKVVVTTTGARGPSGLQGPDGADGPEGPAGAPGGTGAQGPTGPTGPKGDTGTQIQSVGDSPPASPVNGQTWFQSSTGKAFIWYVDVDSAQWVQTNLTAGSEVVMGGGGGSGDDLDTTPVAAIGSSIEQTVPEWLAGAPIIVAASDVFIGADHRGAWVHLTNAIGAVLYLPGDWLPGWAFGARQIGTGPVSWATTSGASMQVPFTKIEHSTILEQYEEVVFRVISNSDGTHAVWGFSGATA